MKTKMKKLATDRGLDSSKITLAETKKSLAKSGKTLDGSKKTLARSKKTLAESEIILDNVRKTLDGTKQLFSGPILLFALSPTNQDYIPGSDGDFDEWQKNFVSKLAGTWEVGGGTPVLRVYLGIPDADWFPLLATQGIWTEKFAKGGKEANRTGSDTTAKQVIRKVYEKALREFIAGFIRGNKKATADIKRAMKLTVPDTEPSPLHSTDAPVVALKGLGGGMVDVHCRRANDQTRNSMIINYRIEIRYVMGTELPPNPDDISSATTVTSSKSHFKIDTGIINAGKKMKAYARWIHEHDEDFDSPWGETMTIVIA